MIMNYMSFYRFWNVSYLEIDLARQEVRDVKEEIKKYGNVNP